AGYEVDTAANLAEARERVEVDGIDLVLTDLKMPGGSGLDLLAQVKESHPETDVILMTAFSSIETAVDAMRRGAFHYLPKPFRREDLLNVVGQVRERVRLRRENEKLRRLVHDRYAYHRMLGRSEGMQEVFRRIEKVHSNAATVLIRGESGTGKELVARAIHASGVRRDRPFVAINCAAIPEMLIESELFGHEKGAFTGAISAKAGRFEEVDDGTLFLDEIGSMQFELQSKLLRVIQEREFQRIGGTKVYPFRGRIVAATSQDLEALMHENRFRPDLYFRLNVVPVEIPPLRERKEDLPLLAMHFLRRYGEELGKPARSFDSRVLDRMESYSWPGNVRELENVIQRMVVLADEAADVIGPESLPAQLREPGGPAARIPEPIERATVDHGNEANGSAAPRDAFSLPPEGVVLADLEASLIRQALERSKGRLEPAAKLLGITYKTLQYRIKKYGLQNLQH
ncbi:MAG TPA: sigma-54 dependent transcriptional regulator, partial [Planctomycetota bacterium]|nr:sigma-54 dependent transcriptional regulator [Planctomycetota bacterium]